MTISVALCTYNGGRFIAEQLQSIINQSLRPTEIVVCDDGSKDDTVSIIESFQEKYPGLIHLHINEQNLRVNKNFEKAISLCNGDFIFLSDQDDLWKTEKVEKTISIFEKNPNLEGVFSNGDLIDDSGIVKDQGTLWENVLFLEEFISDKVSLYFYLTKIRNMVTGAALCIKRETKQYLLPFPGNSSLYHDEWIALVLTARKTMGYTKEKLFSYRIHSGQQVGVLSLSSLERNRKIIQMTIGDTTGESFSDLVKLRKSYFRNYKKFKSLKENYPGNKSVDVDSILSELRTCAHATEKKMKSRNLPKFLLTSFIDKLRGKRQFN